MIAKLKPYSLPNEAVSLLESYLIGRMQRLEWAHIVISCWKNVSTGVHLGSVLLPLLYSAFINGIFYFVLKSVLCNYADDNILSFIEKDLKVLKMVLEEESIVSVATRFCRVLISVSS